MVYSQMQQLFYDIYANSEFIKDVVLPRYQRLLKAKNAKLILQGKVTKLKREVRNFDKSFEVIHGLISLKCHIDEVSEAMKRVSLKKDGEDDGEEDDEEDDGECDGNEDGGNEEEEEARMRTNEQLSRYVSGLWGKSILSSQPFDLW
ncbi:uncharacterized protein N7479_002146 [Penicillium vulpinum]|uniref:uncharacterized protein n=1 Tax=Penicillium vulpinum TaxID=29845 RepID=UPI002548A35E|nr:uncharacterized protein N7479_002146 [Penicillium vulpinum]KAJ5972228.1 hypothetical protein N7479_002146 [Penicillium vulpinum]